MPNKTIYVKPEDVSLWDSLAGSEESISSMFAEFLRSKANREPESSMVHILTKRYSDHSGFFICGVTSSGAVAQAFCAGGESDPHAESYQADIEDVVRGTCNALQPTKWE